MTDINKLLSSQTWTLKYNTCVPPSFYLVPRKPDARRHWAANWKPEMYHGIRVLVPHWVNEMYLPSLLKEVELELIGRRIEARLTDDQFHQAIRFMSSVES